MYAAGVRAEFQVIRVLVHIEGKYRDAPLRCSDHGRDAIWLMRRPSRGTYVSNTSQNRRPDHSQSRQTPDAQRSTWSRSPSRWRSQLRPAERAHRRPGLQNTIHAKVLN